MKSKIKVIIFLLFLALTLAACGKTEHAITIVDNEYGNIICQSNAKSGDEVHIDIDSDYNYAEYDIYINGVKLTSNSFEMPDSDVEILVSLASTNDNAYDVSIVDNELVKTISNLSKANPGDKVKLISYVSFNCIVKGYLVNGDMISGNTFTMPNESVTVETICDDAFDRDGIALTVETYYHRATSYWNATYTTAGLLVDVSVDDDVVFTTPNATNSVGMRDNIEFICGVNGTTNTYAQYIKVLISGDGSYYYQRNNNGSWYNVSDSRITFTHQVCTFSTEGFNGYRVSALVPYTVLNTNYEQANGNLTLLPAMRNTLNVAFTTFGIFTDYGSTWEDHSSHPLVNNENKIVENVTPVDILFVGDALFANYDSKNIFKNDISSYKFYCQENRSISYWQENITLISRYNPKEVILQVGDYDLLNDSVLKTFEKLTYFIEEFRQVMPNVKLTLLSAMPIYNTLFDVNKTLSYNTMVVDYIKQFDNMSYLDIATGLFVNGELNSNLYAGYNRFTDVGYRYLTVQLKKYFNLKTSDNVLGWGSVENYIQAGYWSITENKITTAGNGTCYLYQENMYSNFLIEANFSVNNVLNGDSYPKFGYVISSNDLTQYYYVDAAEKLTAQDVGVANMVKGEYNWDAYKKVTIQNLDYTAPEFINLKLIKVNENIIFVVNGEVAFNISVNALSNETAIALFSFNLNYAATDLRFVIDEDLIAAELEVLN